MKNLRFLIAVAALLVSIGIAQATTTWTSGTSGSFTYGLATTTTDTEAAPTSSTAGVEVTQGRTVVVTAVAHIAVNTAGDVGMYDPGDTGVGGPAINTFGTGAKLRCFIYDPVATKWARYTALDLNLSAGETGNSISTSSLPPGTNRVACLPQGTNVPLKVYIEAR